MTYPHERRVTLVLWLGSWRRDLRSFPLEVQREIGAALIAALQGDTTATPIKGRASVLEIVPDYRGDTSGAVDSRTNTDCAVRVQGGRFNFCALILLTCWPIMAWLVKECPEALGLLADRRSATPGPD